MRISKQLIEKIELAFAGSWWSPLMNGARQTKPIKCGNHIYTAIDFEDHYTIYRNDGKAEKYVKTEVK